MFELTFLKSYMHSDASDAPRLGGRTPNVHVVLSGMSAEEQLADNLSHL